MKTITTLAAIAAASLATLAPAAAQDSAPLRSVTISHADLDLRTEAGRATFGGRLRLAIREVCGAASAADLRGQNEVAACRRALAAEVETRLAANPGAGTIVLAAR